jgi:hypothetical protein
VPVGQVTPQPPQFFGSSAVTAQEPLHSCAPAGHWQLPPWQLPATPHLLLQPPQSLGSVVRSTQTPLQVV